MGLPLPCRHCVSGMLGHGWFLSRLSLCQVVRRRGKQRLVCQRFRCCSHHRDSMRNTTHRKMEKMAENGAARRDRGHCVTLCCQLLSFLDEQQIQEYLSIGFRFRFRFRFLRRISIIASSSSFRFASCLGCCHFGEPLWAWKLEPENNGVWNSKRRHCHRIAFARVGSCVGGGNARMVPTELDFDLALGWQLLSPHGPCDERSARHLHPTPNAAWGGRDV